jgi:hypothetical protein
MARVAKKKRTTKRKAKKKAPVRKKKAAKKKTAKPAKNRGKSGDTKFKPGQSGNPAGRPKGVPNKVTKEVKELAHSLLTSEKYLKSLTRRLHGGKLAPGLESMLFYYAYGKPIERVKHSGESFASIVMGVANRPDPVPEHDEGNELTAERESD